MTRLVLFDIDETMIHSSGCGRKALERALFDVFNEKITFEQYGISLSGKTDPQIISEVLHAHGLSDKQSDELLQRMFEIYLPYLEEEVRTAEQYKIHDGVHDLIAELAERKDTIMGLLTGNIEPGARIKLRRADLNRHFEFGAFGCDSANRMDLPAVAHKRAKEKFGTPIEKHEIVIIGDAEGDVRCAKGYGAKALAVCTGRTSRQALEGLEPHFLFDSLKDTAQVVEAIYAD